MQGLQYNFKEIEHGQHKQWYEGGRYAFTFGVKREEHFAIDTPPPTVSGTLHIGHVLSFTQTDFIARFKRMQGFRVFYPIGFDDNGLPTERLVEKVNKVRARDLKRHEFQDLCRATIVKFEAEFEALFKRIGISFDWNYKYQTASSQSIALSQMSFLDLYHKGKIIRKNSPTFWDSADQTAIAQAEIEDKPQEGFMNYIDFAFAAKQGAIQIATTRPELMGACVAVLFNPEDERYRDLLGQEVIVPVFGHKVQLIADSEVEIAKGTGLVMCCTYGDVQDIVWQERHNLPIKNCIDLYGRMQNSGVLDGLKIKAARLKIIEELQALGVLIRQEAVAQAVKCAERSGEVLELIATNQWYVETLSAKDEMARRIDECKWHPDFMRTRAKIWNENLSHNWCISRQRYFGVPIPVWYSTRMGEEGEVILPEISQLPVDPSVDLPFGYKADEVRPEMDVMDTWATSAITPSLATQVISNGYTLQSPEVTAQVIENLQPFDLRPQSHEIIRTWAYYTILKSHYHNNALPWRNAAISGWCLAKDNSKMSKSKNNTIDPLNLLEQYGSDVVRYWASSSRLGVDTAFSEDVLKVGKKLLNKLWNAAKFVDQQVSAVKLEDLPLHELIDSHRITAEFDLWVITKLTAVIYEATKALDNYNHAEARGAVEDFFLKTFCDNYLEICKKRSYDEAAGPLRLSALYTMRHVLNVVLRLFMPFMPHLCNHLHGLLFDGREIWPDVADEYNSPTAESAGDRVLVMIEEVRKIKSEQRLALNAPLEELTVASAKLSASLAMDLRNVTGAKELVYV